MLALKATERPLVLVDNCVPSQRVDAVLSDNFGGGRAAVAHLVEHGHRDVAFIGGPFRVSPPPALHHTNTVWSIEQRALGYWDGAARGGHRARRSAVRRRQPEYRRRLPRLPTAPGGVALHGNLLRQRRKRGRRDAGAAPGRAARAGDVSVVGFDDIEMAAHLIPPLTTVRVDKEAIGAWAVRRLLARALAPAAVAATLALHVELIQRETVAAPPRRTRD